MSAPTQAAGPAASVEEFADLRRRVVELEAEVAQLKAQLRGTPDTIQADPRWWRHRAGAFADDPTFEEAVRLGREWREAQRAEAIAQADAEDAANAAKATGAE